MSRASITSAQFVRYRAIFFRHATERLKAVDRHSRQCIMRMLMAAEQTTVSGAKAVLGDDLIRSIFFNSTSPGFRYRDDESYQACRLMMQDIAELKRRDK